MPVVSTHAPGTFCWFELNTTDIAAARKFYMALFGWSMREDPTGASPYTMFRIGENDVAAGYTMMKEQLAAGTPPHWMQYVSVASAADTTAKATAAGGTVLMGPMDVMDIGRMAVLRDPQGASFAIWEPLKHFGVSRVGELNTHCWSELMTPDAAGAERFYTRTLPWTAKHESMGGVQYVTWKRGESQAAGMMTLEPGQREVPPHWGLYFSVADCDAAVAKASSLGGKVLHPAFDAGDVGRCALLADPQGAPFWVIRLKK